MDGTHRGDKLARSVRMFAEAKKSGNKFALKTAIRGLNDYGGRGFSAKLEKAIAGGGDIAAHAAAIDRKSFPTTPLRADQGGLQRMMVTRVLKSHGLDITKFTAEHKNDIINQAKHFGGKPSKENVERVVKTYISAAESQPRDERGRWTRA